MTDQTLNKIIEAAARRGLQPVAVDIGLNGYQQTGDQFGWVQELAAKTNARWFSLIFKCQSTQQIVVIEYSPAADGRTRPRAYTRDDAIDERLDGGAIIAEVDEFGRRTM